MISLYYTIIVEPLYNILVFLVDVIPTHDLGLAIILLTIIVRIVLLPISHSSVVTQRKMKEIEPKLKKIKEQYAKNKEEQVRLTMALYKEHGVNPFSGFLALLIQFPVLIGLFTLLRHGISLNTDFLYSFVKYPETIKTLFLGLIDMAQSSYFIAVLAGISQFLQIHLSVPKTQLKSNDQSFGGQLQKSLMFQTKYIMPIIIIFIGARFVAGLTLYWTTSNVFAILHEILVARKAKKIQEHGGTNPNN